MKKIFLLLIVFFAYLQVNAENRKTIRVSTNNTDLILKVAPNGRLYQSYLGSKLLNEEDIVSLPSASGKDASVNGWEVYAGSGAEDYFEPAVAITHNDGNPCTILRYVSSESKAVEGGTETIIRLRDDQYPVDVTLHYVAYPKEDVIKTWSEISHQEKKPVMLSRYSSTMLYFSAGKYFLTEFSSDWAKEVQMSTQELQFGKKILDTKLGSRAAMFVQPFFELGFDRPANEHQGDVLLGTIGWTGNFRFTFEVDNEGNLRVIPAINPYASYYELAPKDVFKTPEFIFTLSKEGTGKASRNIHAWARNYQLKDGKGDRMTLLNNWENTGFKFDEKVLVELMKEAKHLGVDMFLLDDGWFANKYPRNNDHTGLGDWEATKSKLPNGVPALVAAAKEAGVKFGIWIEPEMVSEDSDLYRAHPDWAMLNPKRNPVRGRNQLVLDFSRKEVRDYIFEQICSVLDQGNIEYVKWDMNRSLTDVYSVDNRQGKVAYDYVLGVYDFLERLTCKYPDLLIEGCCGGGGRFDAGMLYYTPQIWCSDNTDALDRLRIQYGTSFFYPMSAIGAHVSAVPNHQTGRNISLHTRGIVAMTGAFGYELSLNRLTQEERQQVKDQIRQYKEYERLISGGDYYRLTDPYKDSCAAWMFVSKDQRTVLLHAVILENHGNMTVSYVRLKGLLPEVFYEEKESKRCYQGAALMQAGIPLPVEMKEYPAYQFLFQVIA